MDEDGGCFLLLFDVCDDDLAISMWVNCLLELTFTKGAALPLNNLF